jgi:uncharacterized lipoprotein YajG
MKRRRDHRNEARRRALAPNFAPHAAALILIACAALGAWGCSSQADSSTVTLNYTQPSFLTPVEHADGVGVRIVVQDDRADKSKVGDLTGDSGATAGPITSTGDITKLVRSAVRQGLETRGFSVGTGQVALRIAITRFSTLYNPGLMGGASDTYVELNVQVVAAGGKAVFQHTYMANAEQQGFKMSSRRGAAEALDDALDQAVTSLLTDDLLLNAIVAAASAHPPRAAPSS